MKQIDIQTIQCVSNLICIRVGICDVSVNARLLMFWRHFLQTHLSSLNYLLGLGIAAVLDIAVSWNFAVGQCWVPLLGLDRKREKDYEHSCR